MLTYKFWLLIRRILQPFTKARSFYQRHAGLFKKILLGLLCLGEIMRIHELGGNRSIFTVVNLCQDCCWEKMNSTQKLT